MKPKHLKPEMALAVLQDRKTMTRMPIKIQPPAEWDNYRPITNDEDVVIGHRFERSDDHYFGGYLQEKPAYKIGDVLYIRERARLTYWIPNIVGGKGKRNGCGRFVYMADETLSGWIDIPERLKPIPHGHCVPNGCFRELARIFVKITGVKVEWSEDMSLDDIIAEGVQYDNDQGRGHLREKFNAIWNSCYPELMGDPHWRFAYTFERIEKP